jgi:predicted amidophosphoribosyltransferase
MNTERKCAYCGTPLNVGARACHACARRQPNPQLRKAIAVFSPLIVIIGGFAGWAWYQQVEKERWMDQACLGAVLAGNATLISCPVHDIPAAAAAEARLLEADCNAGIGYACDELTTARHLAK